MSEREKSGGKERRRILIASGLYPPDIGGPATYSKQLEDGLSERGFSVDIASFGSFRRYPKGVRHLVYFLWLLKRGAAADCIYALDPVSVGFPAAFAAVILRKRFFLKVVGDYAWEQFQIKNEKRKTKNENERFKTLEEFQTERFGLMTEARRLIEWFAAKRAERVVVPSAYLKNIILQWGVPERKIVVIHNAFEPAAVSENKEALRRELGLRGVALLSAGRLVPWKGFGTLIELMPEIAEEIPGAKLCIVGDGPDEEKLRAKSGALEAPVYFTGRLGHETLAKYVKAADLFVLNTGYEGFSHVILEAMAAGTPVVTTAVGGNPELVEDGKTGILVTYDDKKELGKNILTFCRMLECSSVRVQNMRDAARKKAHEFTKERMLCETARLFTDANSKK